MSYDNIEGEIVDSSSPLRNRWQSMTTPLSKRKLIIFGGVFLAVVLLVVILVATLSHGGDSSSFTGSSVLKEGPVIGKIGDLNAWLKDAYMYKINDNWSKIGDKFKSDSLMGSTLRTIVWSVGASNCTAAQQKDAVSQTIEGIDAVSRVVSNISTLTMVSTKEDMLHTKSKEKIGVMIALDGGYTIDSRLAVLRIYHTLGARILKLTGNCSTPWATNSGDKAAYGLTNFGKDVVKEANRLGIILDLAGSSEGVIKTVLSTTGTPPILFNGVGAGDLNDNAMNLKNQTISDIKKNSLQNLMMVSIKCDFIRNKSNNNCTINELIAHIDLISKLSSRSQVGIAIDFSDPPSMYPADLQNITQLGNVFDKLYEAGWSANDLKGLAYNNFLNLLSTAGVGVPKEQPLETVEAKEELTGNETMACYSDLSIRYPSSNPTPTTLPTSSTTLVPATPTNKTNA